jgi:hypothetical protein
MKKVFGTLFLLAFALGLTTSAMALSYSGEEAVPPSTTRYDCPPAVSAPVVDQKLVREVQALKKRLKAVEKTTAGHGRELKAHGAAIADVKGICAQNAKSLTALGERLTHGLNNLGDQNQKNTWVLALISIACIFGAILILRSKRDDPADRRPPMA